MTGGSYKIPRERRNGMDRLRPGSPLILIGHLGRLPGGGSPDAVPAKSGGGGGPALEETSREGGTRQSWAMPLPRDAPTPTTQSPQPHLRAGAVPGAAPTSQPILPVTSRGGEPCSRSQKRKLEPRRTDQATEAAQQGSGPRSQAHNSPLLDFPGALGRPSEILGHYCPGFRKPFRPGQG